MGSNRSIVGTNSVFVKLFYKTLLTLLVVIYSQTAFAKHVKGGYIQYTYNGVGSTSGTSNYTITVTVFFSCTAIGPRTSVYLGIFNASTNATVAAQSISTTTANTVTKTTYSPCMSDPPTICYEIYTYVYKVDLPDIAAGYILTVQDALRTDGIINISNSGSDGITISASIPGTISGTDYHKNNSPDFLFKDTAIICYKGSFSYPFSATDADGDSLSYSFGNGLNVSNASANTSQAAPASPPYTALTYLTGYSGASPLGSGVTINPVTGLISGTAPATTGEYVVAVYVKEWRKGVLINTTKKELQVYVYSCSLSAATLNASYTNCDNYTFTFQNEATSSNITSYYWDFGVTNSTTDISTQATPTYTYADTGTYTLKLKVGNSTGCTDSTTAPVKVYPGFTPAFTYTGSCYQSAFQFTDATYAKYGAVNSWSWTFGESSSSSNTAAVQDPSHLYASAGSYTVSLNVGTSKGCSGTVSKTVTANDKPVITLPFTDTLICSIDSLPLIASADGSGATYSWSPAYNIINPGTADPIVYPKDTTVYTVTVTQNGCVGTDSITVNVLDFITVKLPADTTICLSDSFQLRPVSYALKYLWSPGTALSDSTIKYPNAAPAEDITYLVTANLGKCQDKASINVHVYPYPQANAGTDTTICYGTTALLNGTIVADLFTWSPDSSLLNSNSLGPVADPLITTSYILTVRNTQGCPKPVADTVVVNVIPKVVVFAGNDTSVVVGEPLQLHAVSTDSALVSYSWTPTDWLNNSLVYDPVATIESSAVDSIVYLATATTVQGCYGSDALTVKVYKTGPDIFMANAFTPDGNGHNDVFRPVLVGITRLSFFRVYNRWGQMIFATTQPEKGWDGLLHGIRQESGTYVYMVQGVDYLGKTHFKKGTFILIR
ncbi:MAG TPA: PKD domain-containing protein [Puia sp.]|nr:PKD domain-containing protein [Puia sp.]